MRQTLSLTPTCRPRNLDLDPDTPIPVGPLGSVLKSSYQHGSFGKSSNHMALKPNIAEAVALSIRCFPVPAFNPYWLYSSTAARKADL